MTVFLCTAEARKAANPSHIYEHRSRIWQGQFNLGGILPARGTTASPILAGRAAINDILEVYHLRPHEEIGRCWVRYDKTVSGRFELRTVGGPAGEQPDATASPAITRASDVVLTGNIQGAAAIVRGTNEDWATPRSKANQDQVNAVALWCEAASTAAETAIMQVTLEIYTNELVKL